MITWFFFLPASMRAWFYCRNQDFESFMSLDGNLSLRRYEWLYAQKERPSMAKENEFMLKDKLGVPSFLLIRKNSEVEKHFLAVENNYLSERRS